MNVIGAMNCGPECPGCQEEDCLYGTDTFDRSNSTNIDTGSTIGWTEASGAWEISSNKLASTSAGIALCDLSNPLSLPNVVVTADVQHTTHNSSCDLIVAAVDSSNYYVVRYIFNTSGNGSIKIEKVTSGTPTTLVTFPHDLGTIQHAAKVCVSDDRITAYLDGVAKITTPIQVFSGDLVGVSSTGSGTANFDNFSVSHSYSTSASGCEVCEVVLTCSGCTPGEVPATVTISVSGLSDETDMDSPGQNCASLNGTFVLDYLGTGPVAGCFYLYTFPSPIDIAPGATVLNITGWFVNFASLNTANPSYIVQAQGSNNMAYAVTDTGNGPYPCDEIPTLNAAHFGAGVSRCNDASATVVIEP
jgi:hypothetical protein